nr:MAG TPA: hypothetical protein [Caudoviricetes sp.]
MYFDRFNHVSLITNKIITKKTIAHINYTSSHCSMVCR